MRRGWTVLTGVLLLGGVALGDLAVTADAAGARVVHGDKPAFCTPLRKAFKALTDLDLTDFDSFKSGFGKAAKQLRAAAKSAPADLKSSMKKVAKVWNKIAHLDIGDVGDVATLAIKTHDDFERVRDAANNQCGLDIGEVPAFD